MPAYANGTVYGKYIKIKSGTAGVKKCSDYIKDPEKIQPLPKNNQPKTRKTYQAENAIHYIQNDPKILTLPRENTWYPAITAVQIQPFRNFH